MPTTFRPLRNNAVSTLRFAHAVGDGLLRVANGTGVRFGEDFPIRVTCERAEDGAIVIFEAIARSTDDLTISGAIEGTTDIALAAEDACEMRVTAAHITDLAEAIEDIEATGGGASNGLAIGDYATVSGDSTVAVGRGANAEGRNTIAGGNDCSAEGFGTYAGYPRYTCAIAGATVTITGQDATDFFGAAIGDELVALTSLSGGSGEVAALGIPSAVIFSGGNTVITLAESATSHIAGKVSLTAYVDSPACHAEGIITQATGWGAHAEGYATVASGDYSHAEGFASVASLMGQHAYASGQFDGEKGNAQGSRLVVRNRTTDATATDLVFFTSDESAFADDSPAPIRIRPDFTVAFDITIAARQEGGAAHARFTRSGLIANNAGATALVGTVETIGTDINTPGWSVAITADDTNDALTITVTGAAATTIRWVAVVNFVEVGS